MRRLLVLAALCGLTACEEFAGTETSGLELEPWRAETIRGGGDGVTTNRQQGLVLGARDVEAGEGTIFPGRESIVQPTDFVNNSGERTVSLNLVGVSIEEAAAAVLGELLNENYVIDPGVTGTVNIRSSRPISRTTVIEVLELALKQNGAALVRRGELFAITPLTGDLTIGASAGPDIPVGYSIRVVTLRNIGAQEMAAILQPFAGSGVVGIDAQRNIIVLAGTSADQRSWQQTIDSFDVDWLANRSVGIFPIRGRSAQSIVNGLESIVETDESFEPIAVFAVIPENNSILAVSKTPSALENVSTWIKRLTQDSANDGQIYSYDMKYANAEDVAPTLSSVLGITVETSNEEDVQAIQASITDPFQEFNGTRIVASSATNTLLIFGTQSEYERILGLLHRLDVPPRQVMVEATILEVSLNDTLRYGVQYFFEEGDSTFGLTSGSTQAISPTLPGFSAVLGDPAEVVIDALDDVTEVNVISSPNLMILNNQSARLVVGDQIPIATRTATDASNNDQVFTNDIEYRETGVIFEVTPRINSSGSVVLDIQQEVSDVAEAAATADAFQNPTITERTIQSSISVDSGETIALGGLFETRKERGNSGVPILKDIPVLGAAFGRTSNSAERTELLVLITPRIVNGTIDARKVTRMLRNRVQAVKLDDASLSTAIQVPELHSDNAAIILNDSVDNTGKAAGAGTPAAAPASTPDTTSGAIIISQDTPTSGSSGTVTQTALAPTSSSSSSSGTTSAAFASANAVDGEYYAYLGEYGTRAEARERWRSLKSRNPDVLNGYRPRYATSGGNTILRLGPMTQATATDICIKTLTACHAGQ
ncbi:MAG: type II secretion system secretin GspD [Pseudomonadota bacterium]